MKKIVVLLLTVLLCLTACSTGEKAKTGQPPAPPPVSTPEPVSVPTPEPEPAPEPEPVPEPDYALFISDQPISTVDGCLVTDRLPVRFINNTGEDGCVLDIPHLERQNAVGEWEPVPWKEGVGFCGTPSLLPAEGRDWSEDMRYLWGPLEDGTYRLSYEVGPDERTEDRAYGEFTLYTPEGIHGLPLAESQE